MAAATQEKQYVTVYPWWTGRGQYPGVKKQIMDIVAGERVVDVSHVTELTGRDHMTVIKTLVQGGYRLTEMNRGWPYSVWEYAPQIDVTFSEKSNIKRNRVKKEQPVPAPEPVVATTDDSWSFDLSSIDSSTTVAELIEKAGMLGLAVDIRLSRKVS